MITKAQTLKFVIIASMFCLSSAHAQMVASYSADRTAKNSIYAEGLGLGGVWSVNYERMVFNDLALRIGFGYFNVSATETVNGNTSSVNGSFFAIPITASYLGIHSGGHALELGGGASLWNVGVSAASGGFAGSATGFVPVGTLILGYRYQPPEGGFNFRIGASPLFGKGLGMSSDNSNAFGVLPWGYVSVGWTF